MFNKKMKKMKKIFFKFNDGNQLQLVKGCPTDWNGDNQNNDDYNHDGHTDKDDHDYYDGYMDGYYSGDDHDGPDHSDAWNAGQHDGDRDGNHDNTPGLKDDGPNIEHANFHAGSYNW